MRIVSGKFKRMRFEPPKDIKARPTTDFAKENIFNVIGNIIDFEGIRVLDLFAGTGSISYEFISRGAERVTAVEMSQPHINFIRKTSEKLQIDNLSIYRSDVFKFLKKDTSKYDIIFADPPYQMPHFEELVQLVFERELLKDDGMLIIEHGSNVSFSNHEHLFDYRHYGSVNFSLFRN